MDKNVKKCSSCHDMGYICEICANADGECTCDEGPELIPCPLCARRKTAKAD